MRLERLKLVDYRNVAAADLHFDAQFTVLWGQNGAGKTNLLEAVYLVSTLRSFRSSDLGPLIRHGAAGARVELWAHEPVADLATCLSVRLERTARTARRVAQVDGKTVRAARDFYGRVRAVLFTPEDLGVLRGSPSGRRQFLDRVVFARERAHIVDVQDYEKLLRSRNRVLKGELAPGGTADRDRWLDTYDQGLAETGARIWARREALVEELRPGFLRSFAEIHELGDAQARAGVRRAGIDYRPRAGQVELPEDAGGLDAGASARQHHLLEALRARRGVDLERRSTTVGPHLDDLDISLDGALAGDFASQGQSRALVLAFKIAELRAAREKLGAAPLLLLDDVTSELDPDRNAQLFATLGREVGQCLLTTTAPEFIRLPAGAQRRDVAVRDGIVGDP